MVKLAFQGVAGAYSESALSSLAVAAQMQQVEPLGLETFELVTQISCQRGAMAGAKL